MSEHQHDADCGCGEDHEHEEHVFIIANDEGEEREMVMVYTFESEDMMYAVLLDRQDPEQDGVIFRVEEENEEAFLVGIEDDEEWNRVQAIYEEIANTENGEQ
ncbi:DUF1292 domain-containing protein [Paenibacillus endoradicis]|uniref:DUF1292 domain-containing protein n=1 Tax=Candidatus Pristimantibacillus lignocellulolyticus TaxID=2994561 RepID=A0A9J6ZAZ8_9BACL|nr:DUF1292 domain-containing protein [Paenibacillus endoradicis]MCR8656045.1 DUF1292 domain-containing protein [Paenibacillus endoradicis]MCR8658371.1 DUF1292 domain-containing protein [Paenibacillus endoradicis]URN93223.1 MAG: DUF1292 domain-containing protein [Candidatus Pristimantibacillus lignocellulolyticus]